MVHRSIVSTLLAALLVAAAGAASAQAWQWKDEQGRMQFSDQPPPAKIRPENIIKSPAGAVVAPTAKANRADNAASKPAAAPAAPAAAATPGAKPRIVYDDASAPKAAEAKPTAAPEAPAAASSTKPAAKDDKPLTVAEKEADYQKRKKEQEEASAKAEKEAAQAKEKQQACTSARNNLAGLESGQRMARTNAKGEREFLDDAARAAEASRAKDHISKACN